MANSEGYHESEDLLSEATKDRHRAIASLQEELEAVDWYDQRVDATTDADLAAILAHNRDEEKEHAMMTLEWLRRKDPVFDEQLRTYLFTTVPVTEVEDAAMVDGEGPPVAVHGEAAPAGEAPANGSLGIGSLRGVGR